MVLISNDTGTKRTYSDGTLKKLFKNNSKIDLLILTHIDEDHIGGMIKYFIDTNKKENIFKQIWFNSGKLINKQLNLKDNTVQEIPIIKSTDKKMSVKQGISLENKLKDTNVWYNKTILANDLFTIENSKIQILSPQIETLKELSDVWEIEKSSQTKMAYKTDYHKSIVELKEIVKDELEEKGSLANRSSIAFLLTHLDKNILFGGDAFPSVICNSLKRLGFSNTNKLKLDLFKVSHHCSKFSVNNELLQILDCDNFVISTNGHGGLPSKECLTRIISYNEKAILHFNYSNTTISNIFTDNEQQDNSFIINYLDKQNYIFEI